MEEQVKKAGKEVDTIGGGGGEAVRVLVVDDSPSDRKIVEMLLKNSGGLFEVIAVESGEKAMEVLGLNGVTALLNDKNIDVILTDYCMPQMTGYDLLKAVKEHSSYPSIPVVMMSSENDPQRISRCQGDGAIDFILKPLKVKDVQRLRSYALGRSPISKSGTKRKLPVDWIAESSSYETCQCCAEVAVS
ncbi:two-component response regulator ORR2-like [Musa acuminata AAA Group]|uniref:two-component response regulator ORR2-like n=1 Tax=Musa acuminata AAA Group TaxID=214697 RepID=UPI0031D41C66